jgi:O-methyltransferase
MRQRLALAKLSVTRRAEYRLYRQYRDTTMVPCAKFIDNLLLCRQADRIDGAIVECGCWRGGMSAAMAQVLPRRESVLFDSFEGLPPVGELDGNSARAFLARGDTLAVQEGPARDAMRRSGSAEVRIIKGWFSDTVPKFAAEQARIAVLRLDGDWYESTMTCLEHLLPLVPLRGLVIIDDYDCWEGCTRAVHDYLSAHRRPEPIQYTRYGTAYLWKREAAS